MNNLHQYEVQKNIEIPLPVSFNQLWRLSKSLKGNDNKSDRSRIFAYRLVYMGMLLIFKTVSNYLQYLTQIK